MKKNVVRVVEVSDDPPFTHSFFCPGCQCDHGIVQGRWSFNGDLEKPTINPSILVHWTKTDPKTHLKVKDIVCHSFVKDGNIQFLTDSTHELAGKTVPLESID